MAEGVAGVKPALFVTNGHHLKPDGIPSTRTKLCIIGFAPSTMADAKVYFNDPNFEIWGINQLYIVFPAIVKAATRWFQIHARTEYDMALRDHKHHEWLAGLGEGPTAHGNQFPHRPFHHGPAGCSPLWENRRPTSGLGSPRMARSWPSACASRRPEVGTCG